MTVVRKKTRSEIRRLSIIADFITDSPSSSVGRAQGS